MQALEVLTRDARALAWTSIASGVLLPGGGIGGLAISGWLMRLAGAPTAWIVRRSSALFFFTSAVNGAAIIAAGLVLVAGGAGPHDFQRAALPLLIAAILTLAVAAAPWIASRRGNVASSRLGGIVAGVRDAELAARHPNWRLGQMLSNLAMGAGRLEAGGVWDLEDEEALAAARRLLGNRAATSATGA